MPEPAQSPPRKVDVVVVGAGLAGLERAVRAHLATLYDADTRAGRMWRPTTYRRRCPP